MVVAKTVEQWSSIGSGSGSGCSSVCNSKSGTVLVVMVLAAEAIVAYGS